MPETVLRADNAPVVRPILKWAGGKRQLLPALRPYYPETFARYVEPFVGSGAVFLDLHNLRRLSGREVQLSDINADVIGCYRTVRDSASQVIDELRRLDQGHREGGRQHFYEVRDLRFNPSRLEIHASDQPAARYTPELAAMLIYLNRTGYNGLFRVNASGRFNVPAGRQGSVRICDADNLHRLADAFARPGVSLEVRTFDAALAAVQPRDFVYLDPPYAPLSRTAQFTSYTAGGFGPAEQERLQQAVVALARQKAHVLLSNSVAPEITALYDQNLQVRRAGLRTRTVPARRAINSRASARGAILEYLITNVKVVD